MTLDVQVLGGIRLSIDGVEVALPRRVQLLLGVLHAHRRDGIHPDALLEELYDGAPPSTAAAAVRVHLSKLRDALEPDRTRGASTRIGRVHGRWLLRLAPEESDVGRFEALAAEARHELAEGSIATADALITAALAIWEAQSASGEPYPDLDAPHISSERARLAALRRDLGRLQAATWLDLGRSGDALARVRADRANDPFDEQLLSLEARACYQLSGPGAALEVVRAFRATLADELGLDPSAAIDALESALLSNDPALGARPAASHGLGVQRTRHSQQAGETLIGREDLLASLNSLLETQPVVCLQGVAGVGKSALLRQLAGPAAVVAARPGGSAYDLLHDLVRAASLVAGEGEPRFGVPDDAADPLLVAAELRERLTGLLVVDDCEELTDETVTLLADRVAAGARLLLARRSGTDTAVLDRLQPTLVEVPPLSGQAAQRLAARLAPHGEVQADEVAAAGGVPLLIEYAALPRPSRAPAGLTGRLLGRLGLQARRLAEVLAVMPGGLSLAEAAGLAEMPVLEELLVAGAATLSQEQVRLSSRVLQQAIVDELGGTGVPRVLARLLSSADLPAVAVLDALEAHGTTLLPAADVQRVRLTAARELARRGENARAARVLAALPREAADELLLGRTLLATGDTATARPHLIKAGQLARAEEDSALVLAALEASVGLLAPEAAEGAVINGHAAWLLRRPELTGDDRVLVRELQSMIPDPAGLPERVEALLGECADAGTPLAALVALMAKWRLSFETGRPAVERLVVAESAVTLAGQLGDRDRLVRALRNQLDDLLASGDRRQFGQRLERLRTYAHDNFHAEGRWWCEVLDVAAMLRERPEVSAVREATFAVQAAWPQIPDWWRDDMVVMHEAVALFCCGERPLLLEEMERLERGASELEIEDRVLELLILALRAELIGVPGSVVTAMTDTVLATPPGWRRPAELYLLGRAAIQSGVAEPRLIEALTVYADTWVCIGTGAATFGPMAAVLAGLSAVAGDNDAADRFAEQATLRCADMCAPAWAADGADLLAAARSSHTARTNHRQARRTDEVRADTDPSTETAIDKEQGVRHDPARR